MAYGIWPLQAVDRPYAIRDKRHAIIPEPHLMQLASYYFGDPRLLLVPIEHLGPDGLSADFAAAVAAHG